MLLDVMLIVDGQVYDLPPVPAPRDAHGAFVLPAAGAAVSLAVRPTCTSSPWLATSPTRLREVVP